MPEQTERLAILFADISGSTMLYETLGNLRARQLVVRCIAMMTNTLAAHQGRLIKTIGDEIMCTFPSADAVLRAACDMQNAVEGGKPGGETPMYIRIGFNFGEVLHEAGDVHGDAVNVAARLTEVARTRQILATRAAVEALPQELRGQVLHIRRASIKGRQQQLDLFLVRWRTDEIDSARIGTPAYRKPEGMQEQLVLRHGGQEFTVSERNMGAILGHSASCEIVVRDGFAAERHARVEFHRGKFVASDRSDKGTYVRFGRGDTVHVVREDIVLHGSGAISLGRPFSDDTSGIIAFSIRFVLAPV